MTPYWRWVSEAPPIWAPMGQKKVSLSVRCPHFGVEMHARVVLGVGIGVLFSEVSSVQEYSVRCM